jgi:hypothetical protein
MPAKAYRLLRAVLWTAVKEDELLRKNPCRVPGADQESPVERPHLMTLVKLGRLIEAVPDRYRLLILVTAIASLRFGEVTALERQDIDLGVHDPSASAVHRGEGPRRRVESAEVASWFSYVGGPA